MVKPPLIPLLPKVQNARHWWQRLTPTRQDRLAMLAPLVTVLVFFAAIVAALSYLQLEEIDRDEQALRRDVEYAQQRLRLRLLEPQERITRLSHEVSAGEVDADVFRQRVRGLMESYPEIQAMAWVDERQRTRSHHGMSSDAPLLEQNQRFEGYSQARRTRLFLYARPMQDKDSPQLLQMFAPMVARDRFVGVLIAEISVDGLFSHGIPSEISARYAVSLRDHDGHLLAGRAVPLRRDPGNLIPWRRPNHEYSLPVTPLGTGMRIQAQTYRTSQGLIGSGLFWLLAASSLLTAWMLIGNWRHTRSRQKAQQALVAETNFRRAMENSMLTGMRAMDLQGRITYVNPAFCQMTGWNEEELIGLSAPFPFWPESDKEQLASMLEEEMRGNHTPGGMQVRVKRRDGTIFDARLYLSPLIDAMGTQTGWVTSMTDITEPNRVRQQLAAAHQRFTTVLEALDASISVAPLGSKELLFANKLYRQWFGLQADGHLELVMQGGMPMEQGDGEDSVDSFAGLPTTSLSDSDTESAEIYIPQLGKWLEVRTRYLSWVDGRLAQLVIATDISTRREAEQQAAQQAERAQSVSRLITMGEMASSVAHELNQPLTAITNYCSGMLARLEAQAITEEELLGALEKTNRQAQRAGQIIQRIRSFVKRSEPKRTLSDIETMVNEAVELADIEMRKFRVRLSHYLAARLPKLMVDPILIEQVLVNLLRNAAESVNAADRALTQRFVELRVLPREVDGKKVVEFSVTDSGKGLSHEVQERLFEAFFSTKTNGMGIGLSLCRSIVESHMGRMVAENLYNAHQEVTGCRFSFWIPITELPALPDETASEN
ncbi:PAS domain S-box protein [Curvibacter sp. CHRR-16]|uniref:PAS domain S-box protein n=1 Tax=Curvibacter sp. CHRR-16 TaxID=2835872 RepID=UPI001BDA8CC3|nr:PAS domain S-box protein [Curvibacter sp. CHRR-16]MBT0571045.1 PAS domain S-box protein [Curvibacter sp. CHRR-16]